MENHLISNVSYVMYTVEYGFLSKKKTNLQAFHKAWNYLKFGFLESLYCCFKRNHIKIRYFDPNGHVQNTFRIKKQCNILYKS